MRVRGDTREALDLSDLLNDDYHPLLFYPSVDAIELDAHFMKQIKKPVLLIVPDGNWRQASKVHYRHQELKDVPRVKIGTPNLAEHHLRAETTEAGMSTLQAIACAIGVIEGPEAGASLMSLYEAKLKATLIGRGHLEA
jgi:DTW domain-containing protein YfiP